ncbi:MAG: glycosyltransferase [Desulfovibrionaceae bacterium]|nr:glycosyltransferase [Desulfovibrionaceae bacterium]
MKKLSIITICYNEPNVEETCRSIVEQTWNDFEWIVVDGGSRKETLDVFEKYRYRMDKFISEPDTGIYNACNKGIKLAQGEYIQFLNAGDSFYSNTALKDFFSKVKQNASILYGILRLVDDIVPTPIKISQNYH